MRPTDTFPVDLPMKRPFPWRVWGVLVMLYFLGNLAGIPLLRRTGMPVEPPWQWGVWTVITAGLIALSLMMANRTGLGAPLLERRLPKEATGRWLRTGLSLTALMLVVGMPFSLVANLGADRSTYPFGWELLLASFKAGVVEEIFSRLFLVSLFAWVGRFFKRDLEGRPGRGVYWLAILVAALMFGWSHVDSRLGHPSAGFGDYALIMVLCTGLGFCFGWLFWKLGLEWAMFAHFAYDAFVSLVLIPVYLSQNAMAWLLLIVGSVLASILSIGFLSQRTQTGKE